MDDDYAGSLDDDELLERLAENPYDNFDWLVRKYKDPIFKVAYNMLLRNPQDAKDVTQETFLKAWLELDKSKAKGQDIYQVFRPLKEGPEIRLRPWLFTIVRNECLNHRRDKRRLKRSPPVIPSNDESMQDSSPEDKAIQREDNAELYHLLGRLPERQREIIILYYIGGLSDTEIASILTRKLNTIHKPDAIKKARQRAFKRLQEMASRDKLNKKSYSQKAEAAHNEYFSNSDKENTWNRETTI